MKLPCFLCGSEIDKRIDKNEKPYFICDPCGLQAFVRRKEGIDRLERILKQLDLSKLPIRNHANSLHEIQGILDEIDGISKQIKTLDKEIGIFFVDEDKAKAQKLLKIRLKTLLSNLEQISKGNK